MNSHFIVIALCEAVILVVFHFSMKDILKAELTSIGPGHAKTYAICEQQRRRSAAHPRSLISTFVVRWLDSMICILTISKASFCSAYAGLNHTLSKIAKDTFLHDVAQLTFSITIFVYWCFCDVGHVSP